MEWMILPLKRYADFSGRSRRQEYWMFALFQFIVYIAVTIVGALFAGLLSARGGSSDQATGVFVGVFMILIVIVWLALLIPVLAVTVRRFHDQDKSGWFTLLCLIPSVGGLVLFVFMCLEGTRGPNRYGDDPKARGHYDIFA